MDAAAQQAAATAGTNLSIDKFVEGGITCLRLVGTIDESFDGKRLASTIRAQTLILDMGGVKKISSFGIREWTDFIKSVEKSVERIIAIECTPKVVDQLNMVAEFLGGKGQVFSFYAPYRCDYCDVDRRVLFQVDRDQGAIRGMRPPEHLCETCSRPEYFDEEPAAFFSYLALQQPFELSPDIAEFLSSKLRYSVTGGDRRLQVDKHIEGRNTYLKFVGNLDGSFPSNKIAEGLEGTIVVDVSGVGTIDLAGAAEWRNFITQTKAATERIFLVGCPPVLLERLTRAGDLGDQVISFTMPYSCSKCATTASQTIDVEQHYDILKFATPPEMKCAHCKSPTVCVAPESLLSRLRTLPRVEIDAPLRKFIKEMRDRKPEKPQALKKAGQPVSGGRLGMLTGFLAVTVLLVVAVVGVVWYKSRQDRDEFKKVLTEVKETQGGSKAQRPPWITSDTPASAICTDAVNRMYCVGVSTYLESREAAQIEAANAALEQMAGSVAFKVNQEKSAEAFSEKVAPVFEGARSQAVQLLDDTRADPDSDAYSRALEAARTARRGVAEALALTGGSAAPAQRADWWWEEYEKEKGQPEKGSEFLVFVRYDISSDALKQLVSEYSSPVDVQGSKVVTMFPGLVWRFPQLRQGAMILEAGGTLAGAGVTAGMVITAIDGEPVRTAADLAGKLKGKSRPKLSGVTPEGATVELPK